jgi:NAD(P)-dependent dehydrogenase (short-subunit alcohol dehydrogenase family)
VNGRGAEAGEAAVRELSGQGGEVAYVGGDVRAAGDCERLAEETAARFGGIDVLCANAGVFPDVKLADLTEDDIDSIFATNVKGCMLSRQGLPPLPGALRPRARDPHELDHRPDHRLSRLVPLRGDEGGAAGLPPHGVHRARAERTSRSTRSSLETSSARGSRSSATTTSRR